MPKRPATERILSKMLTPPTSGILATVCLGCYSLLMRCLQPVLRHKLMRRAQSEPLYAEAMPQRFGDYDSPPTQPCDLWLHAVSLGETRACGILLTELRRQRPGLRVLLTHSTATGKAEGRNWLQTNDQQAWLPWDTPAAVARFLQHFQPPMGILMETEVWPNLVHGCAHRNITLVLANARLSEKSMRRAQRLGGLARPAYQGLTEIWSQSPDDTNRFAQLGVTRLVEMGNLKFDNQPNAFQIQQGQQLKNDIPLPVLLLASSRSGEEQAWGQALQSRPHQCLPWLVPRHPQRFDEVEQIMRTQGWKVLRRSQMNLDQIASSITPETLVLGDTMGEMSLYYSLARVALMGGSFEPHGGQNLIEALACACPVIIGPHIYNFAQVSADALQTQAAYGAADMSDAVAHAIRLCQDRSQQQRMVDNGLALLDKHRGVSKRMAMAVIEQLDARQKLIQTKH